MNKSMLVESHKNGDTVYENKKAKIEFYIISLWLLFLMIIILTLDIPVSFKSNSSFIGFGNLFRRNIIPFVSIVFLLYGMALFRKYKYIFKGTMNLPVKITNIQNINHEHLTFLTTYIIPLICIDITNPRYIIIFITLIIVIGIIYIKTDLFYANPTLALLGYYIYKVETNNEDLPEAIFISYGKLNKNQSVQYIYLDEKILYVGRNNK